MKKTLWMLGIAVTALTSCTQNEVLDVHESRKIQFDPFVGKNTRLAMPINQAQNSNYTGTAPLDNLFQFWVYGTEDGSTKFDGTEETARVFYSNSLNGFTYNNHLTWDLGDSYFFAAYSNGNYPLLETGSAALDTEVDKNNNVSSVSFSEIKQDGEVIGTQLFIDDYQIGSLDLLAATTEKITPTDNTLDPVPFNFAHMLSLIVIELKNEHKDLYFQIDPLTFQGIKKDDCAYIYTLEGNSKSVVWENIFPDLKDTTEDEDDPTIGDYEFIGTNNGIEEDQLSDDPEDYVGPGQSLRMVYFVIPQDNSDLKAEGNKDIILKVQTYHYDKETNSFSLAIANSDPEEYKVSLAITDETHNVWQPGYLYNYKAVLSGDAHFIHFTASVDDWKDKQYPVGSSIISSSSN